MGPKKAGGGDSTATFPLAPVGTFECNARCCCVVGKVVWVAELKGGVAVHNAQDGQLLERIAVAEGNNRVHFKCMVLVNHELWAGSSEGVVHIFEATRRRWKRQIAIMGTGTAAPITALIFDGHSVIGASETGRIVQWNPSSKAQMMAYTSSSPAADVTVFAGLIISGHGDGSLRVWDPYSGEMVVEHLKDNSDVTRLLVEPTTSTLWVGRRSGCISVYSLDAESEERRSSEPVLFTLKSRVLIGKEAVTSLQAITGKVLVTTHCRVVAVVNAHTYEVLICVNGAHDAFIYGAARVYVAETVRAWTIGNDSVAHIWDVAGYYVPSQSTPAMGPHEQEKIVEDAKCLLSFENSKLATRVAAAGVTVTKLQEELQAARNEAQELRLRLVSVDDLEKEKEVEIVSSSTRIKELESEVKRLNKELADANARADGAERQFNMTRNDLNNAATEASKARADVSEKIKEKADVEQQLTARNTEKLHLERQLRDKSLELEHVRGEYDRLHRATAQGLQTKGVTDAYKFCSSRDGGVALSNELEELRKKNELLGTLLSSMEYTLRRKEEEERDMAVLLNGFRRKLADKVVDPHLIALLNATMLNNPDKFYISDDEGTKSALLERNGPLSRYLQSLRDCDPDVYEQLLAYLQHPLAGSTNDPIYDKLMLLARDEGETAENFSFLKKTLPILLSSVNFMNAASGVETGDFHPTPSGTITAKQMDETPGNALNTVVGSIVDATTRNSSENKPSVEDPLFGVLKNLQLFGDINILTGQTNPSANDEAYLKQVRNTFEFILQTRSSLVKQLALLSKRVAKGLQVVTALASKNTRDGITQGGRPVSFNASGGTSSRGNSLGAVAVGILEELNSVVTVIVSSFLTLNEKQRVGVGTQF